MTSIAVFQRQCKSCFVVGVFLKPDQSPPTKLDEIGPFEPQRMTGIFGALVSNDRAAEWVEGEWSG